MKYLEDSRLTQLTTDLTGAILNTRGSGNLPSSSIGFVRRTTNNRGGHNKGKGGKNKQQQQNQSGSSSSNKSSGKRSAKSKNSNSSGSNTPSTPDYYAYNPVGYSTYNNNGKTPSTPSSCRVIYGRVEAYTTKRAGSDKQTAFEVGERYATEMERLNEAVEALKRRHALEYQQREKERELKEGNGDGVRTTDKDTGGNEKSERRGRSRSLDGVTFSTSVSPRLVYDKSTNTSAMMESTSNQEAPLTPLDEDKETISSQHAKRNLPLESILKEPSSNKRCRATSFDISTGPSPIARRSYHHSESSSSLLAGSTWGTSAANGHFPLSAVHPNASAFDEDYNTHPLIPQPSLYQSSFSEHGHHNKNIGPTMVPRRLMTDLILTLNASFPDYDFSDASTNDFCTLSTNEAMRRINEKMSEFAATTDEGRDFLPRLWNSLDDILFHGLKDCEVYSYSPNGSTGEDDPLEFLTTSMANENQIVGDQNSQISVASAVGQQKQPSVIFSPSGGGRIVSEDPVSMIRSSDGIDTSMMMTIDSSQIIPTIDSSPPHVTLWSMNYFFVSRNKKRIVLVACVETMRTPQGDDEDVSDGYDDEYGENDVVFDEARRDVQLEEEDKANGYPSINEKADFSSPSADGESVSVMVEEYTDFDGVDEDGDVEQDQSEFDTGTMSAPSQVA